MLTKPTRLTLIVAGSLAAMSLAATAQAAPGDAFGPSNDFAPQPNKIGPQPPHRSLQWDAKTGRWGLDLEMPQQSYYSDQLGQTRIGVHYKIGSSVRIGPTVSLGPEQTPDGHALYQQEPAPRVRLETTFKF